jgi:hypothetical protein
VKIYRCSNWHIFALIEYAQSTASSMHT